MHKTRISKDHLVSDFQRLPVLIRYKGSVAEESTQTSKDQQTYHNRPCQPLLAGLIMS